MYTYFGHHRCATQWTNAVVGMVCSELSLQFHAEAHPDKIPDDLSAIDFFAHVNASTKTLELLESVDYKGFHVIRDPRDILISSYFSGKYSHRVYSDAFAETRNKLNSLSFDEGLRFEMSRRNSEFESLITWDYDNPNIYETRFEMLTTHPYNEFIRIFEFLGMPVSRSGKKLFSSSVQLIVKKALSRLHIQTNIHYLPAPWLHMILWRLSFKRLSGRRKGKENQHHHYRKGVSGDWRNYLRGKNKQHFKNRWGELLVDLGYEKDMNW